MVGLVETQVFVVLQIVECWMYVLGYVGLDGRFCVAKAVMLSKKERAETGGNQSHKAGSIHECDVRAKLLRSGPPPQ